MPEPNALDDLLRGLVDGQARMQKRLDDLGLLETPDTGLVEFFAPVRVLPGLRGLWYPGSADNTGAIYDASGQQRTLTYNGNPTLNLHNGLVPYFDYDGTGDFHSRADEAGLDILGTETYIAAALRGLTVGGWFWTDDVTSNITQGLITKYNTTGNQRAFQLSLNITGGIAGTPQMSVSVDGTATHVSTAAAPLVVNSWNFVVGRFSPAVPENAVFVNGVKAINVTSVPASVFNSTASLEIGRRSVAATELNGRCAMVFLCAAALPDALLIRLFEQTGPLFGV